MRRRGIIAESVYFEALKYYFPPMKKSERRRRLMKAHDVKRIITNIAKI